MGLVPKVQFARRGDAALAYQVFGDGPASLLYLPQASHREMGWQFPVMTRTNERLARMARIAQLDMRGYGMSDPLPAGGYRVEEMAADALAVMDAAGFERSVVWADAMFGAVAVWIAVHFPERVEGLILNDASACFPARPGYDIGVSESAVSERRALFQTVWGTGAATLSLGAPSLAQDERQVEEFARYERMIATPTAILNAFDVLIEIDERHLLPKVSTPTLVIHSTTSALVPVSHGRYLADHIPGARLVEGDVDFALDITTRGITGEIAEFLTGSRAAAHVERSLQVVLFTDIVGSTERAAAIGDNAWRNLLADFRSMVRVVLDRYDAREVNTRGDDFFAVVASPSAAIEIARRIRDEATSLELEVRSGLHLGEIEQYGNDYAGIAVHIGARIEALADARDILVSQTVRDALVGSDVVCTSRGRLHLKGVPGEWEVFAIDV